MDLFGIQEYTSSSLKGGMLHKFDFTKKNVKNGKLMAFQFNRKIWKK